MDRSIANSPDAQLRLVMEQSSDVVFRVDADTRFEWVSPAVERIAGWSPAALLGRSALEVLAPSGLHDVDDLDQRLRRGETVAFTHLFCHGDGIARWTAVTARPLFDDARRFVGIVGTARDVHDEVEARRALAESEAHYHLLAEHASDVVVRLEPDRRIAWVSPAVTHVLGWTPDEVLGMCADDLIHPDDFAANEASRQRTYDRHHPMPPPNAVLVRLRTKAGGYRWMSARQSVLTDAAGRLTGVVNGLTDVEDLVRVREAAERDQARLQATLDALFEPHVLFEAVRDDDGRLVDLMFVELNEAACTYYRATRDAVVGTTLRSFTPGEFGEELVAMYGAVVDTGEPLVLDDFAFPAKMHGFDIRHFDIRAVKAGDGMSLTWRDVTDRHVHEEELAHQATHDPLTGLANRAALLEELSRALHAGLRSGRLTAVLMLDLDHFKYVNDAMGHGVGDLLLCSAAERLESAVRAGDLVGRLGGDEFVVVMRDLDEPEEALRLAARIVESFRQPLVADGHDLSATASVGIAISTDTSTGEELMREADVALYRAKEAGRDRTAMFNEALRVAADARMVMESQLRPALDLGELVVYFQPEVDLHTGKVCGAEALLRWQHQSGELYAADRFIDLAEETGLIVEIGRWAARQACKAMVEWTARFPGRLRTLYLNLSKGQLADPGLVDDFAAIVRETGIDPSLLCVEIAEPGLAHATSVVKANLGHLRALGVRLAIDDFGSGDAALAHLREHRVDAVKIDRSFVNDVETNDYARRLVGGIAALAQRVGLSVVAEGVETQGQAVYLRELGCSSAHGYAYSGAVSVADFTRLIDRRFPAG